MNENTLWQVLADGIAWVDPDGKDRWPYEEADSLAEVLEGMGYDVAVIEEIDYHSPAELRRAYDQAARTGQENPS